MLLSFNSTSASATVSFSESKVSLRMFRLLSSLVPASVKTSGGCFSRGSVFCFLWGKKTLLSVRVP